MVQQGLCVLPLRVLVFLDEGGQAIRVFAGAAGRQFVVEGRIDPLVGQHHVVVKDRPRHVDALVLEDAEPSIEPVELLGVEAPLRPAFLERAKDPFDGMLADHVDPVLGIEPRLSLLGLDRSGHGGVDPPELYGRAVLEREVLPGGFEETMRPGGLVDQVAHVDDRIGRVRIGADHQGRPIAGAGFGRVRIRRQHARGRPREIRQRHHVDAAVVVLLAVAKGQADLQFVETLRQLERGAVAPRDEADIDSRIDQVDHVVPGIRCVERLPG